MTVKNETDPNIRVSPRHLGQMRSPKFCPTCYCVSIGMGFKYPFDFGMAGLMHNMDRFEKRLVQAYFDKYGELPRWLNELGCTELVAFPPKMTQDFPKLGLTLVGMPDAIFRKEDGSLMIIDYKTAKNKGAEDPFMPVYETQLWGYAQLAEHYGLGRVSGATLVYFGNTLKDFEEKPLDLLTRKGLQVPFDVKMHSVDLDLDELANLLKEFRKYADLESLPDGLEGCKNCKLIEHLGEILHAEKTRQKLLKDFSNRDQTTLNWILNNRAAARQESLVEAFHGWEPDLEDRLSNNFEFEPAPLE